VLEPWITPSLFYRFLNKTHSQGVGMDSYGLCEALGPVEGNRVMRSHWDAWVTEDHVRGLAERQVEVVRLPIGDWTLKPYGPYIGCMDGAAEKIDWFMDMCQKYGIKVLLDIHAMKGSQNGFDNSGQSLGLEWTDENNFVHWPIESANWMGDYDLPNNEYKNIYFEQDRGVNWALDVVKGLMERYGRHPALYAFEPINEPWWNSDYAVLKGYYRAARNIIRSINPDVIFTFHDGFMYDADMWNDLFEDNDLHNVVMDTHFYQAWWGKGALPDYCWGYYNLWNTAHALKYPVWVGEWSLATDVCALWLGGFNDANTAAVFPCSYVECPKPYMPAETAVDVDRTKDINGPFGTALGDGFDHAFIKNGMCATDSTYFSDADVAMLGGCALRAFDDIGITGQFLWTFRNELEDKWSYTNAFDKGWLNTANPVPQGQPLQQ